MAQDLSIYNRLKKLFSTDIIVRNIGGKKLKVVDTEKVQFATDRNSLRDRFNRLRSSTYNVHNRDLSMSYQAARLELFRDYDCVGPDTIIPLPDGSRPTIKELSEKYKDSPQERFYVFSYDRETDSIKLGKAYHPRKKGERMEGYKIVFDDGNYLIGSDKHPVLMRNKDYKVIKDLKVGDSVMPFYQHTNKWNYRSIYNYSHGWVSEHKLITTQFHGKIDENFCVHHKNFNQSDNSPDNLELMTKDDHAKFHQNHNRNILWGPENYELQLKKMLSHPNYIDRKFHHWSGKRKGKKNPFYGKAHTESSNGKRSETLKHVFKFRDQSGSKNPKFREDLTSDILFSQALNYYKHYEKLDIFGFAKFVGCDYSTIKNRISDWKEFRQKVESSLNHKIVSIEKVGKIEVYDITVEKYQNFATDSIICHNTMDMDPILASALDIIADECATDNEMGQTLTIKTEDDNIKSILDNLFYDILNIDFNLWSWIRNILKYGDFFLRLDISPEYGVYSVDPLSPYEVTRIEGVDPTNKNYVKFQHDGQYGGQEYENYEMAHFRLLSDSNFLPYGRCLRGDSKIWTTAGYKEIKDFIGGETVYSYDFENNILVPNKVVKFICSGRKMIYKIKTAHRDLYATENHPIMIHDGSYKTVQELSLSDEIILPFVDTTGKHPKLKVEYDKLCDPKLQIVTEKDLVDNFSDFCRFFGFMLGDGWLWDKTGTTSFSVGDRLDKSQRHIDFIKEIGLDPKFTNELKSDSSCNIHSKYFCDLLKQLGFKTGSLNKEIPDWVWELSIENKRQFIVGFADADGCDRDENTWQIGTINKSLMEDFRILSMQAGFSVTRVWSTKGENSRMYIFTIKKSSRDFHKQGNYATEKIRSIEETYIDDVYDIQVESDLHNFIADGILVHNSHLEPARRVWKQLTLLEDAMLINRIMRAPERRIFYIDIGNIAPAEVDPYMERLVGQMKKVPYIDERTGDYNLRFNLQNMIEDFYLPVRGGDSGTRIENLSGLEWTGIDDIEYVRNKMMSALKIPKAFLGYDESIGGKATLAAEDVRFARTIQRIQKIVVSELYKLAIIHLYVQGFTDASLVNFELKLTNPSTIFEQEKIALWGDKMNVATDMVDNKMFSKAWVYEHLFKLTKDEIDELEIQIVNDTKSKYRLTTIEEDGTDPAEQTNRLDTSDENSEDDEFGGFGGGFDDTGFDETGGLFEQEVNEPGTDNRPEDVKREQDGPQTLKTAYGKSDERDDKDTKDVDPFAKRDRNVKSHTNMHKDKRYTDYRLPAFSRPTIKKSLLEELKLLRDNKLLSASMLDEKNILDD